MNYSKKILIKIPFILLIAISLLVIKLNANKEKIIIDSDMTYEEAIEGSKAPKTFLDSMVLVDVKYYGYDGVLHKGQLVVNKAVQKDIEEVFDLILKSKFPIKKCIPIVKYNWDDDKSMDDNNTSAFNYRKVAGKDKLSNHSWGRAIDINPFTNPAVYKSGKISPEGAKYNKKNKGTIHSNSEITILFKKLGWEWGGEWNSLKDYQHFDKK